MSRLKKKPNSQIEKYYFDMFSRSYQIPEGCLVPGDKPDFVIDGLRKIGIEVTNYYINDGTITGSEQRQRKLREKVVGRAHKIYLAEKRKSIDISFSFNNHYEISNTDELIRNIVALCRNLEEFETGAVRKDVFESIPELEHVYVDSTVYDDSKWKVIQVYLGKEVSLERLENIIKIKEERAMEYLKCDEYWLLIVVDFMDRAQDQEIRIDGVKLKSDIFKKIFVYRTVLNHIIEIQ